MKRFLPPLTPISIFCFTILLWLLFLSVNAFLLNANCHWEAPAMFILIGAILMILDSFLKNAIDSKLWLWVWEAVIILAVVGLGFLIIGTHIHSPRI